MLKHEIKNILIQFFVEEEIFDSLATSQTLVTKTDLHFERARNWKANWDGKIKARTWREIEAWERRARGIVKNALKLKKNTI